MAVKAICILGIHQFETKLVPELYKWALWLETKRFTLRLNHRGPLDIHCDTIEDARSEAAEVASELGLVISEWYGYDCTTGRPPVTRPSDSVLT